MKGLGWLAAVSILSLPAVWPLAQSPFFASDDGLFHLYRLAALDDALRQGVLYPRLFPSFAFGYGQAVLNYYGPLSYYLAEVLHALGAGFSDALKWAFALGYLASGAAAFVLARRFVRPLPALLGAAVYTYFPYHLAETYQRGALAEQLAFVFMPLALWALTPRPAVGKTSGLAPAGDGRQYAVGLGDASLLLVFALSIAALILTHSLTAMIFLPFACAYVILMPEHAPARQRVIPLALGLLAALGLTAFYWLPVAEESRWVGLSAGLDNEGYRSHLAPLTSFLQPSPLFQYPPQQLVAADHPLGLLSLVLLVITLAAAVRAWRAGGLKSPAPPGGGPETRRGRRHDPLTRPLILFASLTVAALFMTVDLSDGVWRVLHNPLTFIHYPWRFMVLTALGSAMGTALAFASYPRAALAALPVVVVYAMAGLHPLPLDSAPADAQAMWQNDFKQRQIGATWTAEYMPWWVRADRTAVPLPSRAPTSDVALPVPSLTPIDAGYTQRRYRLLPSASEDQAGALLRFHQFYLPQWRATLDGAPLQTLPTTELGLLTVALPGPTAGAVGPGILELDFVMSDAEQIAAALSLITLVAVAWFWRGRWIAPAAAVLLVALLASVLASRATPLDAPGASADIRVADLASLVGAHVDQRTYYPGETLSVSLIWLVQRPVRENYKSFVHLSDASGAQLIAQSDGDPVGGFTPTTQWYAGELIEETRTLRIPAGAAPGALRLFTGLYQLQPLQNLPATRQGEPLPDGRIPLGEIQVGRR